MPKEASHSLAMTQAERCATKLHSESLSTREGPSRNEAKRRAKDGVLKSVGVVKQLASIG